MAVMRNFTAGLSVLALCVAVVAPALAGTVTLRSTQFSSGKPVPHLHYEGEVVVGDLDRIAVAVSQYVDCDPKTLPDTGGNCAIITLSSEGGNYIEGLRIAHFLREHAIASRLETGSYCYSACAFAFLGGSGQSFAQTIGPYIDRIIEPGATLGFHAPYVTADSLGELVAQYGVEEVLGGNRDSIALMIQELVGWNVDDGVLARITSMGADEAYTASTAQDLYLLRTALPDAPRLLWAPDPAEALRNACMRLLAHHQDVWPYEVRDRLSGEIGYNIGTDDRGWALSGYRLTDNPGGLTVSYCATHTSDAHLGANADIALYYGPGVEGHMRPALTFFHRPEGWSTLATGGTAAQRIFQRGTIGHFFLPPEAELGGALALTWRMVGE
ncbi:hypothetical protein [Pelagibacterium sediminicola]|uniref:hypothetical protein n=1 Tax=Pelagibacterium sediminicola TaxID=2248761 RepID=UPI0013006EA2|nr:hypothetical protein [Pelagibacterium sediminicola]